MAQQLSQCCARRELTAIESLSYEPESAEWRTAGERAGCAPLIRLPDRAIESTIDFVYPPKGGVLCLSSTPTGCHRRSAKLRPRQSERPQHLESWNGKVGGRLVAEPTTPGTHSRFLRRGRPAESENPYAPVWTRPSWRLGRSVAPVKVPRAHRAAARRFAFTRPARKGEWQRIGRRAAYPS